MANKKRRNLDIASHDQAIKRNPSLRHPWARNPEQNGFVWIHLNARKILDQHSKGVGRIAIEEGSPEVQYAFLAPLSITETVQHNWAEYDSIASRLAQKVRTAAKIGAEWNGLVQSFEDATQKNDKIKGLLKQKSPKAATSLASVVRDVYTGLSPHSIPKIKVDTPLYYENSPRRNFTFEVTLIAEKDPRFDVVEPIKDLMKFSSPALDGVGGINIHFPYMWEVYTRPKEWIKFSTMALTAVQPTYQAPYINNYPSSAILQLTFIDLSPLYRSAIETGSVINVLESPAPQKAREIDPIVHEAWRFSRAGSSPGSRSPSNPKDPPIHIPEDIPNIG